MIKFSLIVACVCCLSSVLVAQNEDDILIKVDDLRYEWDDEALNLESFEGMEKYCYEKKYRVSITDLLNSIHHYDTLLYGIITEKHNEEEDLQAKEALKDILTVESEYTTPSFLEFLVKECEKVKTIEKHLRKNDEGTDSEISRLERELVLYIDAVTERIDLIDENVHHLR